MLLTSRHLRFLSLLFAAFLTSTWLTGCAPVRIVGMQAPPQNVVSQIGNKVAQTAATQLGKPYRSGGESPKKGFDCSGLIYWAFQQNGMQVPRVTTQQATMGRAVPRSQLRPGDILVFRTASAPNGLHTAIYAGQGNFIHSPNKKSRVRYDNLATPYWNKAYKSARRVNSNYADR